MSKKLWFISLLALFALALSACAAQAATAAADSGADAAAAESSEAESAPADEGEAPQQGEPEGEEGKGEGQQGGQPGPQGGQPGPGPQGGQPGRQGPNPPGPRGGPGRGALWQAPHITGEILAIDGDQFTMEGRGDNELTVLLSDETSYVGSAGSLADLAVGDEVAVAGHRGEEEGTLEARVIVLAADLPLGTPMGGEVAAVGSDSITIETRDGQSFVFAISAGTDYLSRENEVQTLADIEAGQFAVVVFEQAADGTLVANLIVVGGQPDEAPEGESAPPADSDTAG